MWVTPLLLALSIQLSPPAHVRLVRDSPVATVTGLTATHRGGQTFLTGTKNAGATGSTTYAIRRSASPITSSSDGSLIATLDANSYRLLYDDSATQNLTSGLIVADDGPHLGSTKILLVWTTAIAESGTWYYAAFTSDDPTTVAAGVNTTSVVETYQATRGAIHLSSTTVGIHTVHRYFAWEPYATWVTSEWGYYGHRFNVMVPTSGISPPYPLFLFLHGAGSTQYLEPVDGAFGAQYGVTIRPVDMDWTGFTDPYSGTGYGVSRWTARFDTSADLWKTCTEDRIVRYTKMVRDNLTGDGVDFHVNSNRVYVEGGSLGSGSMHVASHYPDVFAAAGSRIGWEDATAYGGVSAKKVNSSGGLTLTNYLDLSYYAASTPLRPMIHTFGASDPTVLPNPWTAALALFETYRQSFVAEWFDDVHVTHAPSNSQWDDAGGVLGFLRYALNEAYPAFASSSTSTAIPVFPTGGTSGVSLGQRNGTFDFQNSLRSISGGSAIVDTATDFGISLNSSTQATGVLVTIRNQQNFIVPLGRTAVFTTDNGQTGNMTRNADGSLTTVPITIPTSAMRLSLTIQPIISGNARVVIQHE